ncbi:MAG: hypothetical protein WC236_07265 [Gallionellaceae bacterium]|jgi:hypothetical protein
MSLLQFWKNNEDQHACYATGNIFGEFAHTASELDLLVKHFEKSL